MENNLKKERFHKYIIDDYNNSLIIEKIAKVNTTNKTDGTFTQIGIRPLIDEDAFIDSSNFAPELPSAGRIVAVGERDFLIEELLKNQNLVRIKIEKDKIVKLSSYLDPRYSASLLISTYFHNEIFSNFMRRIDYDEGYARLDRSFKLIFVPETTIGKRIIVINEGAIVWEKKIFINDVTHKEEKIDIQIGEPRANGKIDVIIRSVNKIVFIDLGGIKIIEESPK